MLYICVRDVMDVFSVCIVMRGTGGSVKISENWSHPIPSIGLGRHTTTSTTCVDL